MGVADELTAFQKRLALSMGGTGEGRLDKQSPMVTLQAPDGSRVVMVLGGRAETACPPIRGSPSAGSSLRHVGLDGLADRGLFPYRRSSPQLRGDGAVRLHDPRVAGRPAPARPRCSPNCSVRCRRASGSSPSRRTCSSCGSRTTRAIPTRRRCSPAIANAEGEGEITTRQLVELTRRLNPDRVVVGELVEDEALDMLDVASMCKRGSLATIHAHTADVVLQRLAYYVAKSNTNLPEFAVWSLIAQTVDFVVHIDLVRNAVATRRRCVG